MSVSLCVCVCVFVSLSLCVNAIACSQVLFPLSRPRAKASLTCAQRVLNVSCVCAGVYDQDWYENTYPSGESGM